MSRQIEALKEVGQTFELFQRGEIGLCDSSSSAVQVPNLLPSSYCKVPSVVPIPGDEVITDKTKGIPPVEDKWSECTPREVPPATPRVLTYTQKDVIDDHISIPAQHSLVRLSKNPETSADAVGMLEAVKSRQLEGIYCVNWEKPAQRAIKLGSNWWTVIPEGEDAVLMLDPEDLQDGPPMIAFRRSLHPDCGLFDDEESFPPENARLDAALMRTWETYRRFRKCEIVPCSLTNIEPSGEPTAPETCRIQTRERLHRTVRIKAVTVLSTEADNIDKITIEDMDRIEHTALLDAATIDNVKTDESAGVGEKTFMLPVNHTAVATGGAEPAPIPSQQGETPWEYKWSVSNSKVTMIYHQTTKHIHPSEAYLAAGEPGSTKLTLTYIENGQIFTDQWNVVVSELRLRLSIWAGANKFFPDPNSSTIPQKELDTIKNHASGNVDDISLLWQIQNDIGMKNKKSVLKDEVKIGPPSLVGAQNMTQMKKDWKKLVNACHKEKIQLLAGFKYVKMENGWEEFNQWLDSKVPDPPIDKFAQTLVDFVINELPGCNGISFDIESVYDNTITTKSPPATREKYIRRGDNLKKFYRAVAKKLLTHNPDMIVAIAVGAKSDDTRAASLQFEDLGQTVFDYRVVFEKGTAKPIPNIVLRPMGYMLLPDLSEKALLKAHDDTIKYALTKVGVPPQQFQLGVSASSKPQASTNTIGLTEVKARCTLCRHYRVGLVIFGWPNLSKKWKEIDDALNKNFNAPSAGQSTGQPFQVPITDRKKAFKVIP